LNAAQSVGQDSGERKLNELIRSEISIWDWHLSHSVLVFKIPRKDEPYPSGSGFEDAFSDLRKSAGFGSADPVKPDICIRENKPDQSATERRQSFFHWPLCQQ